MKVVIASDHGGVRLKHHLKQWLKTHLYDYLDFGPEGENSVDYPDYAAKVARALQKGQFDVGILVCSTGTGMSIAANRFSEIRAANCIDEFLAKMGREHNHANVLCLGQKIVAFDAAERILKVFLETPFSNEKRHNQRLLKIEEGSVASKMEE